MSDVDTTISAALNVICNHLQEVTNKSIKQDKKFIKYISSVIKNPAPVINKNIHLTFRENQVLMYCALGMERLEISDIMNILWFLVDVTDADGGMCTMLGHGGKKNVNARYDRLHQAYKESNHPEMTDDLLMIDMSGIDLEEINKCINITGYISKFVKAVQDG